MYDVKTFIHILSKILEKLWCIVSCNELHLFIIYIHNKELYYYILLLFNNDSLSKISMYLCIQWFRRIYNNFDNKDILNFMEISQNTLLKLY